MRADFPKFLSVQGTVTLNLSNLQIVYFLETERILQFDNRPWDSLNQFLFPKDDIYQVDTENLPETSQPSTSSNHTKAIQCIEQSVQRLGSSHCEVAPDSRSISIFRPGNESVLKLMPGMCRKPPMLEGMICRQGQRLPTLLRFLQFRGHGPTIVISGSSYGGRIAAAFLTGDDNFVEFGKEAIGYRNYLGKFNQEDQLNLDGLKLQVESMFTQGFDPIPPGLTVICDRYTEPNEVDSIFDQLVRGVSKIVIFEREIYEHQIARCGYPIQYTTILIKPTWSRDLANVLISSWVYTPGPAEGIFKRQPGIFLLAENNERKMDILGFLSSGGE